MAQHKTNVGSDVDMDTGQQSAIKLKVCYKRVLPEDQIEFHTGH